MILDEEGFWRYSLANENASGRRVICLWILGAEDFRTRACISHHLIARRSTTRARAGGRAAPLSIHSLLLATRRGLSMIENMGGRVEWVAARAASIAADERKRVTVKIHVSVEVRYGG